MPVIQTAAKTFSVSAEPAMGTNCKLTTSCAWGISWATWEVREPRITRKSLEEAYKTGRLTRPPDDHRLGTEELAQSPREEADEGTPSNDSISVAAPDSSQLPRSCRVKRIWADVARQFDVDAVVIERLVFLGVLKLYDPRVTEKSLKKFCARYGALIKTDFLDAETRDWLTASMDLSRTAGKNETGGVGGIS